MNRRAEDDVHRSTQGPVRKFAKANDLPYDRIVWAASGLQVFVPNEAAWREWLKHLRDIEDQTEPKDSRWFVADGTIAAVPVELLLWKGMP